MSNWIGPTVKQLWNNAMHVLHNFFWGQHKHNSFLLGPIQPSSPTTKELHALVEGDIQPREAPKLLCEQSAIFYL